MSSAEYLCWVATGLFFLTGLLTGMWKYIEIDNSENARAHYYVDIAHRASLMYSFSCMVLAFFVRMSVWSDSINFWAALGPILFFALSVGAYILHGALKDTRNQLKKPHTLGNGSVHPASMKLFMWALAAVEIGGFGVLFVGFLRNPAFI